MDRRDLQRPSPQLVGVLSVSYRSQLELWRLLGCYSLGSSLLPHGDGPLPPNVAEEEDYGQVFENNRRWFFGLFIGTSLADICLTAVRGDLFDPPIYLPFAIHWVILGLVGLIVGSRRLQLFFAGWVVFIGIVWSLAVRRLLGA